MFTVIKCFDWFLDLLNFICYDNTVFFFLSEPTSRSEMISRICIKLNYEKSHAWQNHMAKYGMYMNLISLPTCIWTWWSLPTSIWTHLSLPFTRSVGGCEEIIDCSYDGNLGSWKQWEICHNVCFFTHICFVIVTHEFLLKHWFVCITADKFVIMKFWVADSWITPVHW